MALLPWWRSGRVWRSGFELARSLDAAGFVDTGWRRLLLGAVFLLPLLAAVAFTAAVVGAEPAVAASAVIVAVVGAAAGTVVLSHGGAQVGVGPTGTVASSAVALVGAVACVLPRRS